MLRTTLNQWRAIAAKPKPSTEDGLTLLECLIAIAVVGITAALILPPLFLATGTRVQNRRAEQAFQLAQEEINRLQAMAANGDHQRNRLPVAAVTGTFRTNLAAGSIRQVPPPRGGPWGGEMRSASGSCNTYAPFNPSNPAAVVDIVPLNQALAIDVDADCTADFYMQVFRDFGTYSDREIGTGSLASPPPTARPSVFRAAVRVYSTVPNRAPTSWASMPAPVIPASLQFTSGEGNQRERPLAVMNSLITWSSAPFAACAMQYQTATETGLTLATADINRCRGDVAQIP